MKTCSAGWRLCVHSTLIACVGLTGAWLVVWIGFQLGLHILEAGATDIEV